jgi:REP element-mobilizing transposase RayT
MRKPRIKSEGESYYHIVSRCALRNYLLDGNDKSMFVRMMRKIAIFSGLEIINYCVMDNHFHILVHVPDASEPTEDVLIKRIGVLYGDLHAADLKERWKHLRKMNQIQTLEEEQAVFKRRMGDITPFVQNLKQRFSTWYRANHGYITGTIWEGRFGSTLVEGTIETLSTISAYIDLNPVRAGIVDDPADYKWAGYASALNGDSKAMEGIAHIYDKRAEFSTFTEHIKDYRLKLYVTGSDAIESEKVQEVIDKRVELPVSVILRCKIRHFTHGAIIGSRDFVDEQFEKHRSIFGPKRKTGARGIGMCKEWNGLRLCSARDLRKSSITFNA